MQLHFTLVSLCIASALLPVLAAPTPGIIGSKLRTKPPPTDVTPETSEHLKEFLEQQKLDSVKEPVTTKEGISDEFTKITSKLNEEGFKVSLTKGDEGSVLLKITPK